MEDPVGRVVSATQRAEKQLKSDTEKLNDKILDREEEAKRAKALYNIFEQKRSDGIPHLVILN